MLFTTALLKMNSVCPLKVNENVKTEKHCVGSWSPPLVIGDSHLGGLVMFNIAGLVLRSW